MKILLINSPGKECPVVRDMAGGLGFDGGKGVVLPPIELAYMASALVQKKHDVQIIDADVEGYQQKELLHIIDIKKPDAVIATVSLPSIYSDCSFIKNIRNEFSGRIIIKTNIAYSEILKEILEQSHADKCVFGESDLSIDDILRGSDKKGTAYFLEKKLVVEENRIIPGLDGIPIPARHLLPNEKYRYSLLGDKVTTIQTSRGCPFPCAYYCPYPLVQGCTWRARSPEHVLREIENIVYQHNIHNILFRDAVFTLDKTRAKKICDMIIEQKLKIKWWCETRVDCLDIDLMYKMKEAGCVGISVGVETGDPQVMRQQAKAGLTIDKLSRFRKLARKMGLRLHFLLMLGLPKEDKGSIFKTYELIRELNPETLGICIVTPYPGTLLYCEAQKKEWIETYDWTKYGGHTPVMHTDNLSVEDLMTGRELLYQGYLLSKINPLTRIIRRKILHNRFKKWIDQ